MKFHKTKGWVRKRKAILRRDDYMCQEARRYGKTKPANTVHHIYPVEQHPELGLVDWNLISMCEENHNKMHNRITGELTDIGRQWQARRRQEFENFYRSPPSKKCFIVNHQDRMG